jgi:ATP-dependent phosphofructokinase / diphosphate-dependent phosphofructokinase
VRIAISTGGGDAPGLNAVIRAAVLSAIDRGWHVLGVKKGYAGLLGDDEVVPLTRDEVRGIGHLGGTILRTTNRGNPFSYPVPQPDGTIREEDRSDELLENARNLGIDAFISIGGDGSLAIAQRLAQKGARVVCVPKTIDNDVSGTITSFGFDTAVNTAMEAIDKLHTTAESHDRVIVIEVMGRYAGFIALHSGVAGAAHAILIPEIPYDIDKLCAAIKARERRGRHFDVIVAAEGAYPQTIADSSPDAAARAATRRVGGVADVLAKQIQAKTAKECRSLVLGHLQRGGMPTGYDRLLATRFGGAAVQAVEDGKWGQMVALQSPNIVTIPLADALREPKRVDLGHDLMRTARRLGISFGD